MSKQEIKSFLNGIKREGRSSPSGMYWNDFFMFLKKYKKPNEPDPPVPLILAASGEPDASKHNRLSMQLEWAMDYQCLCEAITFLNGIHANNWNSAPLENWAKSNYWDAE